MTIKIFSDIETTGLNPRKHSMHQLAGLVEIDGKVVDHFNIHMRPHPKAEITDEALAIAHVTRDQILAYPEMAEAHKQLLKVLNKHIPRYEKGVKAYLAGFNNRGFADQFLRSWFSQNSDPFFSTYFWSNSFDASVSATQYLIDRRPGMKNFQLGTVAKELGIPVQEDRLHDALYDAELARQVYRIAEGFDVEL